RAWPARSASRSLDREDGPVILADGAGVSPGRAKGDDGRGPFIIEGPRRSALVPSPELRRRAESETRHAVPVPVSGPERPQRRREGAPRGRSRHRGRLDGAARAPLEG